MTYLELVQFAIRESGSREESPSTLTGLTGLQEDFRQWVGDAWYELQLEKKNPPWWFRVNEGATLALSQGTETYSLGLYAGIDWRTVTCYETARTDETPVCFIPYNTWRTQYATTTYQQQKPKYITQKPDGDLAVFPIPDKTYTLHFDAVNNIQDLNSGPPIDGTTPTGLPAEFHRVIAYAAVMRYAEHHEDGGKFGDAERKFRKIYDKMVQRQLPPVMVERGALYGSPYLSGY